MEDAERSGEMSMANVTGSSGWLVRSICWSQTSNGMTALVLASSQMPRRSRRNSSSGMAARSRSTCSALMRMPRAGLAWAHAWRSSLSARGSADHS
jgi:hypothetical protein